MRSDLLARVRWANVGLAVLVVGVLALVVAWPLLGPRASAVPPPSEPRRGAAPTPAAATAGSQGDGTASRQADAERRAGDRGRGRSARRFGVAAPDEGVRRAEGPRPRASSRRAARRAAARRSGSGGVTAVPSPSPRPAVPAPPAAAPDPEFGFER